MSQDGLDIEIVATSRTAIGRPERSEQVTRRDSGFAINGRFLTQRITGVQRYAKEITRALNHILIEHGQTAEIIAPAQTPMTAFDNLEAMDVKLVGPFAGHLWEQTVLAGRCDKRLLNFCNTAPMVGTQNVVCVHDANVFTVPESYSRSFRTLYKMLQPSVGRRALMVTTVSADAGSKISHYLGIPPGQIQVLGNGHEHALRWDATRSDLKPARRPFVLVIGSLARHKNIARLIGLADALDVLGLDLAIAGGSAGPFAGTSMARKPNVQWLGPVSDDDMAFLLKGALCLAFPSLSEGFGLPALEAMALGCPVVASSSSSLPEVCGDAVLYADPGQDAEWLGSIRALAQSVNLQDALSAKGRARAKEFSWANSAQGYYDLLAAA